MFQWIDHWFNNHIILISDKPVEVLKECLESNIHFQNSLLKSNFMKYIPEEFIGVKKQESYELYLRTSYSASSKALLQVTLEEKKHLVEIAIAFKIHTLSMSILKMITIMAFVLATFSILLSIAKGAILNIAFGFAIAVIIVSLQQFMIYMFFKNIFDKEVLKSTQILKSIFEITIDPIQNTNAGKAKS